MFTPFKRVLIVSASVGAGHQQAAKALAAEIRRNNCGVQVRIADFMGGEQSYLNSLVKEAYLKMIHLSPNIYDLLYRWSQAPSQYFTVQNLVARAMKRTMARLYYRHRPDVIVFTHPFPCSAAAYLKRCHRIDVPLVAVVTDFAVHPLWLYEEVDMYFVASEACSEDLIRLGAPADRVYPTGIPIDPSFREPKDRRLIAGSLGFDPGLPIVLVMGGGLGFGSIERTVQQLEDMQLPLQLIVVAGKNPELRRQVQAVARTSRHRIVTLGYTHRIQQLMSAADLLVTKPGALTLSEALASSLPMVLVDPIPGQEEDNARYLVGEGAAVLAKGKEEVAQLVARLFSQPDTLNAMRENARRIAHPQSAAAVAQLLVERLGAKRGMASG
ncbi:MAG TPA: glycosyltransferase [Selenomonadales bacterium]|nr:glycosyltransferase [Selenomonadales bacterium]